MSVEETNRCVLEVPRMLLQPCASCRPAYHELHGAHTSILLSVSVSLACHLHIVLGGLVSASHPNQS